MAPENGWATGTVGELLETIVDYRGKTPPKSNTGIPLISAANVKAGRIVMDDPEFISLADYEKWARRGFTQPGDVLITTEAPAGEVAPYPREGTYQISRRVMALRPIRSQLDSGFLLYALQWSDTNQRLLSLSRGTTVPRVLKTDITGLKIPYPPPSEQKAIAAILGALDDKIELNRRMNETLEAMARAIFKSWFVDFDPVRAKMDGRQPHGMDADTAALFPDQIEHTNLGMAPLGWKVTNLGEVIEIHDSKRIPLSGREREKRKGPYPYYGAASVMDYVDDFLFDGIYVLMGEDGSVINDDGTPVTQYVWGQFWVNNHAHVLNGKNGVSSEHLLLHLRQSNVAPFVTGAVQPKLNQRNMKQIEFVLPPKAVCDAFSDTVSPLFARYRSNTEESKSLAATRDALLPKLLSGEIRVVEAEKIVQGV